MSEQNLTILAIAAAAFVLYRLGWFRLPGPRPAPVPPTTPAPAAGVPATPAPHYIVLPPQPAPPAAATEDGEPIVHETSISVPFKIRVLPQPPSQPPAAAAKIGF